MSLNVGYSFQSLILKISCLIQRTVLMECILLICDSILNCVYITLKDVWLVISRSHEIGRYSFALLILDIGYLSYKSLDRDTRKALSWEMNFFHSLNYIGDGILHCLKKENMIGSGGSGKLYKRELCEGEFIALKQLWTNNNATKINHNKEALR